MNCNPLWSKRHLVPFTVKLAFVVVQHPISHMFASVLPDLCSQLVQTPSGSFFFTACICGRYSQPLHHSITPTPTPSCFLLHICPVLCIIISQKYIFLHQCHSAFFFQKKRGEKQGKGNAATIIPCHHTQSRKGVEGRAPPTRG